VVAGLLRDRAGTGFWHKTYFRDGAVESVYIDMPPSGLTNIATELCPVAEEPVIKHTQHSLLRGSVNPPGILTPSLSGLLSSGYEPSAGEERYLHPQDLIP
jgi:hypothetical protein